MNVTSIGDLAQSLMLRSRSTALKQTISRLTLELSSGQVSDVTSRVGGDYSYLNDINHRLAQLDGYAVANTEARIFTDAAQSSLERVQDVTSAFATDLIASVPTHLQSILDHGAARARTDLESTIAALNTTIAGRTIFGGVSTDIAPLADVETLLNGLESAISGLSDPDDIRTAATAWFDDPAGFRATAYAGGNSALAPLQLAPGQTVSMSIMADNETLKDLLRNLALSALANDTTLGFDLDTQNDLLRKSGEELLSGQEALAALRSDLGFVQSRVEQATARNQAARSGFEISRATLLEADPYETATWLEDAQFQLESLYAVTVRNAQLSMVRFLE
ncbi:flagellin [Albibacillus kandeliae]|uniref:flagellin n=1 Tax=Albibacillus kandeliae TaxID=2174228 RepID=UPI000D689572|nr:flagellin [Albibacillus kandeliae]